MIPGVPKNATHRLLGPESSGIKPLNVRRENYADGTNGFVSVWEPAPEELDRLRKGARVEVRVYGNQHPPICVDVGEV